MEETKNEETLSLNLSLKKYARDTKNCNFLFSNSSPDSASTLTLNANAREPNFMDLETPSSISEASTIKPETSSSPNETISSAVNTGNPNLKEMLDEWTANLDNEIKIKDEEEIDVEKLKEEIMDNMTNYTGVAALAPQVEVKDHLLRNDMANMVMTDFDTVKKESDKLEN